MSRYRMAAATTQGFSQYGWNRHRHVPHISWPDNRPTQICATCAYSSCAARFVQVGGMAAALDAVLDEAGD